jgi:hypothetical protein
MLRGVTRSMNFIRTILVFARVLIVLMASERFGSCFSYFLCCLVFADCLFVNVQWYKNTTYGCNYETCRSNDDVYCLCVHVF